MKYILILSLFLTGCCAFKSDESLVDKTEFFYNQEVRITSGFYKGLVGKVRDQVGSYSDCYKVYEVSVEDEYLRANICNKDLAVK